MKRLLIEALLTFIGIDLTLLVRRLLPLDETTSIIALKLIYSFSLLSAATSGVAATIIYMKPKSSTWKVLYSEIVSRAFLPFVSFISLFINAFILCWAFPLSVELGSCPPSHTPLYIPILDTPLLITLFITFIVFLSYPAAVFLLASYATENAVISRDLRMFAICVIGVGVSHYLQTFFFHMCLPEASDIIRIPCLIIVTYIFRRMTALQRFYYVDLEEYIARLRRLRER